MRVGQGSLSAKTFEHGLSEAESLDIAELVAMIVENPDLHDQLVKAL
ncbi:hypothetical protein ILFOPFJJ_05774 [Ensifer psoraleae]|nr:hypothetical protein [Sinorhizobium psoraleae]NRP74851.1 hypothetical protein [Sinorhizobium psoraleae]